ncbi:MAG: hypothetical protein HC913_13860 [Microscillaceae bacterium]|nr:hypothetical protein [Microscillaceae bacterium]
MTNEQKRGVFLTEKLLESLGGKIKIQKLRKVVIKEKIKDRMLGSYASVKSMALLDTNTVIEQYIDSLQISFNRIITADSSYSITNGKYQLYKLDWHLRNLAWNEAQLYKVIHKLSRGEFEIKGYQNKLECLEDGKFVASLT